VPLPSPLGVAAALVAGAALSLAVVVLNSGSVGSGGIGWAMAAGAFACASGLVLGMAGRAFPAGALGVVAVASLVAAGAASAGDDGRRADFPARAELAPPPRESGDRGRSAHAGDYRDTPGPVDRGDGPATGRPSPARLVRAYYAALDRGDYARAWARLSPAVRASFGGFAAWRAGYATTAGHEVSAVEVDGDRVRLVLAAVDRAACDGRTARRFAVTWRLEGRTATAMSARALPGPAAC
jgi:hypothetical protein